MLCPRLLFKVAICDPERLLTSFLPVKAPLTSSSLKGPFKVGQPLVPLWEIKGQRLLVLFPEKVVEGHFGLDDATCPCALQTVCRDERQMTGVVRPGFTDECRNLFAKANGFLVSDFIFP